MRWRALLACAVISLASACARDDGFLCGEAVDADPNLIRKCDGPRQVCLCESNSCAERVSGSDCPSTLRYLATPFARIALAGNCVTPEASGWLVPEQSTEPRCSATRPDGGSQGDGGAP